MKGPLAALTMSASASATVSEMTALATGTVVTSTDTGLLLPRTLMRQTR